MNRMPFGLVNSQSSYQRLMDSTLKNVDHTEPYTDDICVHSNTFEQHLKDVELTLRPSEESNVQRRMEKCYFAFTEVEFIGHIISKNGHSPTPRLVEKIRNVQEPKGKKELQRFLGMATF